MEVHTVSHAIQPATVFMYPKPPEFEEHDRRYYNCCCHVRNGARIVAWIGIILTLIQAVWTIYNISMQVKNGGHVNGVSVAFTFIIILLLFIVNVLVLVGVKKERSGFLLPYLIVAGFQFIALVIGMILVVVALATGKSILSQAASTFSATDSPIQDNEAMIPMMNASFGVAMGVILGVLLALLLVLIWFFVIIHRCRRYLMDKRLHEAVASHFRNQVAVSPESGAGHKPEAKA